MTTYRTEKHAKLVPLIDGDILTYRLGFAADAQAKRDAPETWESLDYLSWALHLVDNTVDSITEKFHGEGSSFIYLTGKDNYRDTVATIKPYKGNRDTAHKPKYYKEIRDYMIEVLGATVAQGQEADDLLGIHQYRNPDKSTVICTQDKDLKMIPGYNYNFVKEEFLDIKLKEANLFFLRQMLTGDSTDNIPGIPKIGDKTAAKLLDGKDEEEALSIVGQKYRESYKDSAEEAATEIAQLLWIRRDEEEICPYIPRFCQIIRGAE